MRYGFDFGLRTRQVVHALVRKHFGVSLSFASVGALLARFGRPTQKTRVVQAYVASREGKRTLHVLPGYTSGAAARQAAWSSAHRAGNARPPLPKGEKRDPRIFAQVANISKDRKPVRSLFKNPSVVYSAGF